MANVMKAKDTLSAKKAECFITIDGNRYNFMQAINLKAKMQKKKTEVPILGLMAKGNKANGWVGSGSATFHFSTSIFRKLLYKYKQSGEDIYFDIQVSNEDPTSSAGRQTIILKDCNIDTAILTAFDADGDILQEELNFSFEDWEMPEEFNILQGM